MSKEREYVVTLRVDANSSVPPCTKAEVLAAVREGLSCYGLIAIKGSITVTRAKEKAK